MDKYNIMRMFCMFDLPVETEEQRRNYRLFRKELIQEGFVMIQYSIYVRVCPSREFANRIENRIKKKSATGRKCASSLRYREAI